LKIPPGTTSFCPPVSTLGPGYYQGRTIRHTFRLHGTQDWLLIYTQAGGGLYRFANGGEYRSRAGDITLYQPGAFQDYQFSPRTQRWDLSWAHFLPRADWLSWLNWPEIAPGLMSLNIQEPALRQKIIRRMKEMRKLTFSSQPRGQIFGLNALEEVLLWCDSINPRRSTSQLDPRVAKVMDYLTTHLSESFSEERLARVAGLSASRLRHLFREQAGNSPRYFQELQRMGRARELLAMSRQTIGEVAMELGFANPFYFTLRFKKHAGESPRAFRQRTTQRR
jgi:AraC family transcriptional regulator of arabinose operon